MTASSGCALIRSDRVGFFDPYPDPYFVVVEREPVNISEATRKCVAFIGIREAGHFQPRATCFFVSYLEDQHSFDHLVTAEHVVSGLLSQGHDIWLRVNVKGGGSAEIPLEADAFRFHPDNERNPTDVAVCPINLRLVNEQDNSSSGEMDVRTIGLNGEQSLIPTEKWVNRHGGLGGQIAIVGLFRNHFGKDRNIPIVRVGNISAKPEEPVWTKYTGYLKAYLVEARSIAGLSGSPVFVMPDYALYVMRALERRSQKDSSVEAAAGLLGLMHGHFDVRNLNEDVVLDSGPERSVHTGIGVVIPVEKIIEAVEHPELTAMRKKVVADLRKDGATPDVVTVDKADGPLTTDENPQHREDFTSLLGKAARTPPQDD